MKKILFYLLGGLGLCVIVVGCVRKSESPGSSSVEDSPRRIVSTVPSITEILFDIGAGDRIVGDSTFTNYPPEAAGIPKIGGLYDINLESVVSLRPDLVITLEENSPLRHRLEAFDIKTLAVDHRSMDGVLASYIRIGDRLGSGIREIASERQDRLAEKLKSFQKTSASALPVPLLLCVDRLRGMGRIQGLYVVGTNPFYREVIQLAGGTNVAEKTGLPFPSLSVEGIVDLAPEVIVELFTGEGMTSVSDMDEKKRDELLETARSDWKTIKTDIPAVKNNRIFLIVEDFATIPGPRTPLLIEKLSEILDICRADVSE